MVKVFLQENKEVIDEIARKTEEDLLKEIGYELPPLDLEEEKEISVVPDKVATEIKAEVSEKTIGVRANIKAAPSKTPVVPKNTEVAKKTQVSKA